MLGEQVGVVDQHHGRPPGEDGELAAQQQVVASVHSLSSATPHLFGDRLSAWWLPRWAERADERDGGRGGERRLDLGPVAVRRQRRPRPARPP